MDCSICSNKLNPKILKVKEMMFNTGKIYNYFQCNSCECLQILPPETDPNFLYPTSYYSFNSYNVGKIIAKIKKMVIKYSVAKALGEPTTFAQLLLANESRTYGAHALKGFVKKTNSILDIGCGDGSLIKAMSSLGFKNLLGIDPYLNEDIVEDKYSLLKKNLLELEGEFDFIMLHHSFEHMHNPKEIIGHINRLLKKDGTCLIRIPVADSFAFKFYKANWVQLDAPRHIFLHTNKSMECVASINQLTITSIVGDSSKFQFIGSEQYLKGIEMKSNKSFYISPFKKMFFNKQHIFSKKQIYNYIKKAEALNKSGESDQRCYYLKKLFVV